MIHLAVSAPEPIDASRSPSSDAPLDQLRPFLGDLSLSPTSPPSPGSDLLDGSSPNGYPDFEEYDILEPYQESPRRDLYISYERWEREMRQCALLAIKGYNKDKNNKIKYSFVEVVSGGYLLEDLEPYVHMNFYAKAKKKGSKKELVFAEFPDIRKQRTLTSFHVLEGKEQFLGRRHDVRSSESSTQDMDHCYACSDSVRHPIGSKYMAGHFVATLFYFMD